jgi:hypothetical protein
MRVRWLPCGVLLGLLLLPAAARPGQKEAAEEKKPHGHPTLVLRVRSLDTVIHNAKLFARLVGKEELGNQFEDLIKVQVGPDGLKGIDPARPFGLYARASEDLTEAAVVGLIPIADEKAFLALLENLNYKAKKNKDGLYLVQQDIRPLFQVAFRFAHKYAYVTAVNLQAIAPGNLVEPSRLFPPDLKADVSGIVRLDQVPKTARDLALGQVEEELARQKEKKKPGENEAQHKARAAVLDAFVKQLANVLENGRDLTGRLDIDPERQELSLRLALSARPGSALAKEIRELGEEKSLFAGLATKGAAVNGLVHLILPAEVRQALDAVIDEGQADALKREPNEAKRRQIERFGKALAPTFKSGELDAGFSLRGPHASKLYTLVAGLKLKDGEGLEQAVRAFHKDLPPLERDVIKLDVDTVGGAKIHRVDAQKNFDEKARKAFGDNPVYVAFRPDAVFLAVGEDGLEAIKEAVAARPQAGRPLTLELSVARLAKTLARTPADREAADKAFAGGREGAVRLTLAGGAALALHFRADLSVIRFAGASYQARQAAGGDEN